MPQKCWNVVAKIMQKTIWPMTKETYYKATEVLAQINDLEENLMTYFGGRKGSTIDLLVEKLGKSPTEAVELTKSALRQKYAEFERL